MNDKIKILYVDDNPLDRALVQDSLEKEHGGFIITEAKSRKEFELIIVEQKFDLVITDFNILGYEGLQVLETVQQKQPGVPVIIVTGTGSEEVAAESIKRGAADYVIKSPQHILRLPQTIKSVFELEAAKSEKEHKTEELVESEERYRQLVEHSPEAIVIHQNGIVVFANSSAFELMKDETQQKFIGENISNIIHPDDWSRAAQRMEKMLAGENQESTVEYRIKNYDDNYIYLEVSSSPIKYKGDVAIQLIARDITDRKIRELEERKNKNANINLIEDLSIEINRRKEAEEKLIENQFLLSKAQNIGNIGSWEIDIKTNIIKWTSQTYKIFEFPESEEINYEKFLSSIHPDDRDYANEKWLEGINNRSYDIEHRILANGNVKWVREKADFEFDAEGNPIRAIGFTQDITEQKNAVQAVNEAKDELEKTELIAKMGGWSIDMKTMATYLSKGVREIYEIEPDLNLPVEKGIEFYAPEHRPVIENAVQECMQTGKRYDLELKLITAKGNKRWVHTSGSSEFENDTITKISGFIQDITEKKVAEEKLLYQSYLLKNISDAIITTDLELRVTSWNTNAESLYGWSANDVLGKELDKILQTEFIDNTQEEANNHLGTYKRWQGVVSQKRKNGELIYINASVSLLQDEEGIPTGGLTVNRDITGQKMAEQALNTAKDELEKTELIAKMGGWSIDVRTMASYVSKGVKEIYEIGHDSSLPVEEGIKFYAPEHRPLIENAVRECMQTGKPYELDLKLITAKGNMRWVHTSGTAEIKNETIIKISGFIQDITDRKKYEEEILELNRTLTLSQQIAKLGYWSFDVKTMMPKWSDEIFNMYGIPKDQGEPSYKDQKKLLHPDDWEYFDYSVQNFINNEIPYDIQYRVVHKNGNIVWLRSTGMCRKDENNKVNELYGIALDITSIKKQEEEIKVNLTKFKTLFETMPAGITVTDNSGKIVESNLIAEKLLGLGKTDHEKRKIDGEEWKIIRLDGSIMPSDEFASVRALKENKTIQNVEMGIVKGNGEITWITVTAAPLPLENYGVVITYFDISHRINANRALKESEEKFRSIVNNAQVGFFRTSAKDGTLLMANQKAAEIFGYKTIGAACRHYKLSEHYVDPNIREKLVEQVKKKGRLDNFEAALTNRLNQPRWFKYSVHHIKEGDYFEGVVEDITERIDNERELKKSEERLSAFFDSDLFGTLYGDIYGGIKKANNKYLEIIGYSREEVESGKVRWDKITPVEFHQLERDKVLEAQKFGVCKPYEKQYIRKDGSRIWVIIGYVLTGEKRDQTLVFILDIQNIKDYQSEIERQNSFIQTVLDNLPIGVALNDIASGDVSYVNKQFEEIYGWPAKDMQTFDMFFNNVYPDKKYRTELKNRVLTDIQSGDSSKMHWEDCLATHKDNSKHIVNAQNIPLYDQNTMVSTVQDITERKFAENQLRESQQRYETLVESALDAISIHINGKIAFINKAGVKLLEAKNAEQLIGTDIFNTIHPSFIDEVKNRVDKIIRGGEKYYVLEEKYVTLKGNVIDVEVTANPVIFNEQKAVQAIVRDVSERKRAQEQIINERNKAERYLESAAIMMLVLDTKGKVTMINSKGAEYLGYSKKYIIGKNWFDYFIPEENRKEIKRIFKKAVAGELVSAEHNVDPILCRYKKTKMVSWRNNFIKDENGVVTAVISSGEDITEDLKLRNDLKESNKKLLTLSEHINKLREQERTFIARELHDNLGQSLTALKLDIVGVKNVIKDKLLAESRINSVLKLADETIKTVQDLTSDLRPGMIDDLGLIPTLEWFTDQYSGRSKLTIKLVINVDESDIDEPHKIVFYRIVQESLTNVTRHAEASKVTINLNKKNNELILTVEDNGKGISKEERSRLNAYGLIGMEERAQAISGHLEISGKKNKGTTVKLTVPLVN